jgi:hypothetical protein
VNTLGSRISAALGCFRRLLRQAAGCTLVNKGVDIRALQH